MLRTAWCCVDRGHQHVGGDFFFFLLYGVIGVTESFEVSGVNIIRALGVSL